MYRRPVSSPRKPRPPRQRKRNLYRATFVLWTIVAAIALSGCPCINSIVNNDPNLRWWAFKTYGVDRLCPEVLKTSVPLKLQDQSPTIGRYFPSSCSYQINEQNRTVAVSIDGGGYAYLPTVKRIGFNLNVTAEYAFDFRLHDEGAWIWGQLSRTLNGPTFKMTSSENKLVDLATVMTPAGTAASLVGNQVVTGFLARGFTVIETDSGKEFSLGILPPGKHPFKPVQVDDDDDVYNFANETADIYNQQRDFLGPYEIADEDQAIQLKGNLVGNGVDVLMVQKTMGDIWRQSYQASGPLGQPPSTPVSTTPIQAGPFTRRFKAPPGLYYLVIDNTSYAGPTNPPYTLPNPLFESAARLTYVSQLIEPD